MELIKQLPADLRVLLIGAPGDTPLCQEITANAGRGEVLAGKLSLLGTAALMQGAHMNYVNDSAPLHIASAMNCLLYTSRLSGPVALGAGSLFAPPRRGPAGRPAAGGRRQPLLSLIHI